MFMQPMQSQSCLPIGEGLLAILQSSEDLLGMAGSINLFWIEYFFDDSLFVDNECGAKCTHIFSPIHTFLCPNTEMLNQSVLCVSYQRERKIIFGNELFV